MKHVMSRREFIGKSTLGFGALLVSCKGEADLPIGKEKIFLNYTEAELDAAYSQREWADNITEVLERLKYRSETVLAILGEPERCAYGSSPIEGLDWYRTDVPDAPIHVHFHGGAWVVGDARSNAFVAEPSVLAGAHVIIPDYVKVTEVEGDLIPLGEQCRKAVAWVYENAEYFSANRDRILISGHSAGGHLAGVVLTTDWSKYGLPVDVVKQGLCISGMFDLYPVSLSSRNEYVSFSEKSIADLSPIRHLDHLNAEVVVAFGTKESPEFQRQSREFFSSLKRKGKRARLIEVKGINHFEIVEDFSRAESKVGRVPLELMRLESTKRQS